MNTSTQSNATNWRVYQFVSIYLFLRFLWAIVVPGGEWPLPPWHYVSMGIDLVLLACVLLMRPRLFPEQGYNDPRATWANILFGLGLVAGIGLLLIRFTSDAAWWTGHLRSGLVF
jgi:hypothetical protein